MHRIGRWSIGLLGLLLLPACAVRPAATQPAAAPPRSPVEYSLSTLHSPRLVRVHQVRVDLSNPAVALAAVPATDPDGPGPATARLESPLELAERVDAWVLVNANPWQALPTATGPGSTSWLPNQPVQILGLGVRAGRLCAPPDRRHRAFWVDTAGTLHMGQPEEVTTIETGVAGFKRLLENGQNVEQPGGPIHPRTAVGYDAAGRYLYLVVADGRQPGYSEGLSTWELAEHMKAIGCHEALNLDGGGSSILILDTSRGRRVMNDPSTKVAGLSVPRPIPIALAVVRRAGAAQPASPGAGNAPVSGRNQ